MISEHRKALLAKTSSYRSMCATTEGPYQSPAFFPEPLPISTSWWTPKGAGGWSPNQVTSLEWMCSCLSFVESWTLFFWLHLGAWLLGRDFSGVLEPRGEPKEGIGTPPARAGERGRNTSKSTSVSCWDSGQTQSRKTETRFIFYLLSLDFKRSEDVTDMSKHTEKKTV